MNAIALTASGKQFDLLHPGPAMVDIRDIAYQLAIQPRYAGATPASPFSIAQHSVHVADSMERPEWRLAALLHDAHEFVMGDLISPVQTALEAISPADHAIIADEVNGLPVSDEVAGNLRIAAEKIGLRMLSGRIARLKRRIDEAAIWPAFGLTAPGPALADAIHLADMRARATEHRDLLAPGTPPITDAKPWSHTLKAWPWPEAEARFIERFEQYRAMAQLAGAAA